MRTRETILILISCSYFSYGQKQTSLNFGIGTNYSWFSLNKQSKNYNKNWSDNKNSFSPKLGYSIGIGIERKVNSKITILLLSRWQSWGGATKTWNQASNYYVSYDINYQSIRTPVLLDYCYYKRNNWSFSSNFGIGIDHTYRLLFYQSTPYGTGLAQPRNVGMTSTFIALGKSIKYMKSYSKVEYELLLNIETDNYLNPNRFNDFGGFFGQQKIPLNSIVINSILKIKYKL
ncbi:MAG: hypothetical protein MUC81_04910 [Bacteroidia bacterium]|jgi:hypothetical protein|nr:hypothetical protein [Bacteroidia bacterium]